MASRFPCAIPRRPTAPIISTSSTSTIFIFSSNSKHSHTPLSHTPSRAATIISRPKRPYTFTQLIQQTDGSTYTIRTTSPLALYKSLKDTRNHLLWQPSDRSLQNVEVDEAGKLAAFRGRFGRGWDMEKPPEVLAMEKLEAAAEAEEEGKKRVAPPPEPEDALSDLVSKYAMNPREKKKLRPRPKTQGKAEK
ncbi:hypothetical protein F5B19DRAFT_494039 [Rostrohypoxylon terebratum]|nr:hypothetical protein F5B19DRAFT_494039 [Rostrohypoxylon terebratum]